MQVVKTTVEGNQQQQQPKIIQFWEKEEKNDKRVRRIVRKEINEIKPTRKTRQGVEKNKERNQQEDIRKK